jgi:hypothetical protein
LLGPALATVLLYISSTIFHLGTFTLLFIFTAVLYLFGLSFSRKLPEYRPSPVLWADIKYFFSNNRNKVLQFSVIGEALPNSIGSVVIPVILVSILGTSIAVGIYNTIVGVGSAICIVLFSRYLNLRNRFTVVMYGTAVTVLAYVWLGTTFSFFVLILYALATSTAGPLMDIAVRAITFRTMESLERPQSDFYANMILRELCLWAWRILAGILFLGVLYLTQTQHSQLSVGLYLTALGSVITLIAARKITKWI